MLITDFEKQVLSYYRDFGRELLWRTPEPDGTFDPYKILVSEIMLQQTQVARVVTKYQEFLKIFPTVQILAASSLGDVLRQWQGLGYNRRAKFLWQAAQMVVGDYDGKFPVDQKELTKLPGVGINTAGAICAYAYNQPVVFIETNIRTVYIHYFFNDREDVHDKELMSLIEQSLQVIAALEEQSNKKSRLFAGAMRNPERVSHYREWYWALMDYGTHLKAAVGNASRSSKHYAKQSKFQGSRRQIRGQVLRLLSNQSVDLQGIQQQISDQRLGSVLGDLLAEGLIVQKGKLFLLG